MPRTRSQRNAQRNAMGSICSSSKNTKDSSCDNNNTPESTNKAISDAIHKQCKNASTKRRSSSNTNGNMAKKAKKIPSKSKKSRRKPKLPPAEALFIEFASHGEEDDPNEICIEGVGVLCEKLGLEIDDVRVMVLLWKLGSKAKPQSITKEEFLKGCKTLDVDSIPKFKKLLPSLDLGFLDRDDFRGMYEVSNDQSQ